MVKRYRVIGGQVEKLVEAHSPSHAADQVFGYQHVSEPRPLSGGGKWEARIKRNRSVIVTIEEVK